MGVMNAYRKLVLMCSIGLVLLLAPSDSSASALGEAIEAMIRWFAKQRSMGTCSELRGFEGRCSVQNEEQEHRRI